MAIGQPIVHNFVRKISSDDPQRTFPTKVVVSHKEKTSLPYQLNPGKSTNYVRGDCYANGQDRSGTTLRRRV